MIIKRTYYKSSRTWVNKKSEMSKKSTTDIKKTKKVKEKKSKSSIIKDSLKTQCFSLKDDLKKDIKDDLKNSLKKDFTTIYNVTLKDLILKNDQGEIYDDDDESTLEFNYLEFLKNKLDLVPKNKKFLKIASIDIGRKNFAQYFEKVDIKQLYLLRDYYDRIPKDKRRKVKGPVSSEMEALINFTCLSGKRICMGVYDLCPPTTKKGDPPYCMETRKNVIAHLEKYRKKWDSCDIIIVEQQFHSSFGKGSSQSNIKAIKVGEGVLMWFMINYGDKIRDNSKVIEYFGSPYKTQILGAPEKMKKPQRKAWSVKKANEICTNRGDLKGLAKLKKKKSTGQKLDDVSDTIIQLQAYKIKKLICGF